MKKIYTLLLCTTISLISLAQTPVILKDINPGISTSNAGQFIKVGNFVFFSADDGIHGNELWKTDGTLTGTVLVKDIRSGVAGAGAGMMSFKLEMNGLLFFGADDGINGEELWKSDGTEAGTVLVKDINPGSNGSFLSSKWVSVAGSFYFDAFTQDKGFELWKSDGTQAGTVLVKDINPATTFSDSHPSLFTDVNGIIFFKAFDGIKNNNPFENLHGEELWKTDGTTAGTVLVKDIKPGGGSGLPSFSGNLIKFNNTLFFAGDDGVNGTELWTSDGTEAGTNLFKDIDPGTNGSLPYGFSIIENTLYFTAAQSGIGTGLWKSDGTPAGTVLVKVLNTSGKRNSGSLRFTLINNDIFFVAVDNLSNSVLWKTDGSEAGTESIKTWPGSFFQGSNSLTNFNGVLYFSASNNLSEFAELWKSDGTEAGSIPFDLNPGAQNSYPGNLTVLNNQLLFAAENVLSGREIWSISFGALPVTLLNFSARNVNSTIELNWKTSDEKNTSLFVIERSATTDAFIKISEIAAENKAGQQSYTMVDTQPLKGSNFYRLKMVERNGDITYSNIARVDFQNIEMVSLSPNPAMNELKINRVGSFNVLQVIDAAGRIVLQQRISDDQVTVTIESLSRGNYVLHLSGPGVQKSLQFVKK